MTSGPQNNALEWLSARCEFHRPQFAFPDGHSQARAHLCLLTTVRRHISASICGPTQFHFIIRET